MNLSKKFNNQLNYGEIGEKVIAKYLKDKGYKIINFNKDMEYDIKVEKDGFIKTIEIKTDRYEWFKKIKTDNMFIEVKCNGKKSGVIGSNADYFIYFFPDHELFYLIRMDKIRELIKMCRRTTMSGDKGRVTGYVVNRFEFQDWFSVVSIKKHKIWDIV